jgi:aryl-alcohol dehydrogenase-like predicted oxidoreductase
VALAWVLTRSAVSAPIVGASKMEHLENAVQAVALKLSADEIASLEAPYQPRAVAGHG